MEIDTNVNNNDIISPSSSSPLSSDLLQSPSSQLLKLELGLINQSNSVPSSPTNNLFQWKALTIIGRGGSSVVYKAQLLPIENNQIVAIKQIDIEGLNKDQIKALEAEVETMKGLQHKNVIAFLGSTKSSNKINLILEYADRGSLRQFYQKHGALKEPHVANCIKQILSGLQYLHSNGIAHRDVKCANCLLTKEGIVKLADFGASKRFESDSVISGLKGTPHWMAPEVIKGTPMTNGWVKADVWSLGCTAVEMFTGKLPFSEYDNPMTAMYHIVNGAIPGLGNEDSIIEDVEQLKSFVEICCAAIPNDRPSVYDLLLHPFITRVNLKINHEKNKENNKVNVSANDMESSFEINLRDSIQLENVVEALDENASNDNLAALDTSMNNALIAIGQDESTIIVESHSEDPTVPAHFKLGDIKNINANTSDNVTNKDVYLEDRITPNMQANLKKFDFHNITYNGNQKPELEKSIKSLRISTTSVELDQNVDNKLDNIQIDASFQEVNNSFQDISFQSGSYQDISFQSEDNSIYPTLCDDSQSDIIPPKKFNLRSQLDHVDYSMSQRVASIEDELIVGNDSSFVDQITYNNIDMYSSSEERPIAPMSGEMRKIRLTKTDNRNLGNAESLERISSSGAAAVRKSALHELNKMPNIVHVNVKNKYAGNRSKSACLPSHGSSNGLMRLLPPVHNQTINGDDILFEHKHKLVGDHAVGLSQDSAAPLLPARVIQSAPAVSRSLAAALPPISGNTSSSLTPTGKGKRSLFSGKS